jgi:tetratricopeptide (TPR) repeat protein
MRKSIQYTLTILILLINVKCMAQTAYDYNKSGLAKFKIADYQGAIEDYTKAIELASDTIGLNILKKMPLQIAFGEACVNRGNSKARLKDYQGAILDYNKAIDINTSEKYDHPFFNRGIAKGNLGDYRGAILDFNKSIEKTPDFADAYYTRGNAKAQLGDKEGSCLDWSKAGELGFSVAYDRIKEFCN